MGRNETNFYEVNEMGRKLKTDKDVDRFLERIRMKPKNVFDIDAKTGKITKRRKKG